MIVNYMSLTKKYTKYNKLLMLNCFRGTLCTSNYTNLKTYYFNRMFIYQTTYSFLFFLHKLKFIFRSIIKNKGQICLLLNKENKFKFFLKMYAKKFKLNYLYLNPQLFSNNIYFKELVSSKDTFLYPLRYLNFISFFIIFLQLDDMYSRQKVLQLSNKNFPFLIFSKDYFRNSYSFNINFTPKKQNFWFFVVNSLLFEFLLNK